MKEENSFVKRYLFSTDHKVIAKQYLLTGLVMAAVGGFLAYVFRHQLAFPGQTIPFYGSAIGSDVYNTMVTMHGTIMVFWVAMPVLLGFFGNFLIPLMIGADDMAFPRLNMASFWTFFASTVVLLASFFVPAGAAALGWTMYPPLSNDVAYSGQLWGPTLWILAVALEFASVLMGGINFLTTTINMRTKGMTLMRLPLMVWMQNIATLIFMFSVGPLIGGALMLLADRHLGTGFFSPKAGGDPLLYQHLFWFFGHPEVYVILVPALGVICEVLPTFSRKPFFGYRTMVYSVAIAGVLSFIVWAHHQFVSGIDPRLAIPFSITTILISVPFAIAMFAYLATLWGGSIQYTTPMLFALGFIALFLWGGVTGIHNGSAGSDIYIHDSYYVVAHFHYTLFPSTFLALFAGIYYWYPKMFGRMMNEKLGKLHFWGTVVFFNLTFLPLFVLGFGGHPRRLSDPMTYEYLKPFQPIQIFATHALYGLLLMQLPFVFNFFYSMRKGNLASRNPWQANTLEWLAPSPPGHGNFDVPLTVVRGPYEFSVPEETVDFLPQAESRKAVNS